MIEGTISAVWKRGKDEKLLGKMGKYKRHAVDGGVAPCRENSVNQE